MEPRESDLWRLLAEAAGLLTVGADMARRLGYPLTAEAMEELIAEIDAARRAVPQAEAKRRAEELMEGGTWKR